MRNERLIPSEEKIFEAERKRTQGRVIEAAHDMRPAVEYCFGSEFTTLPLDAKKRKLMGSRIYVVSEISGAKRSWKAKDVASHLWSARDAITDVYRDPNVRKELPQIKEDTKGNPYEFSTEFVRDEVSYTLTLAALTGNTQLVDEAIGRLNEIVDKAEEQTASTLSIFERERLMHQEGESSFDTVIFQESFNRAVEAASDAHRWERVATIASWYMIDMVQARHPSEAFRGLKTAIRAGFKDHSTATIPIRQTAQALTNGIRHFIWKATTPKDADYSSLKLD